MISMITPVLIPKLLHQFPGRGLRVDSPPAPCAVFPAVCPEVGDIEIYDDGNELTVVAGYFTHGHFSNYDDGLSDDQKAETIVEAVLDFLENLFADRVILYGSQEGQGGWYYSDVEEKEFRQYGNQYVWSGPLAEESK